MKAVQAIKSILKSHPKELANVSWLITEKLFGTLIVLFIEGLIARVFTVEAYGKWQYSINLLIMLASISLVVGAEVTIPALARTNALVSKIVSSAFVVRLGSAIFAWIAVILYACFFINDHFIFTAIIALSFIIPLNDPFGSYTNYFQSRVHIRPVVFARLFALLIRLMIVIVGALVSLHVALFAAARIAELSCLAVSLISLARKSGIQFIPDIQISKILLKRGINFWPSLILMYCFAKMDRVFVENFTSPIYLGQYVVAAQINEQAFLLVTMVVQSITPRFIFAERSRDKMIENLKKISLVIVLASILMLGFGSLFLHEFISMVFGSKYRTASSIAINMLPAIIFFGVDSLLMQFAYKEKLYGFILKKWLLTIILSVSASYIWFAILDQDSADHLFVINNAITLGATVIVWKCRGMSKTAATYLIN